MNQRIKELAIQTDECLKQEGRSFFRHEWNEKFAQLIAADIAEMCANIDGGENMFSRAIREEYGVE